MAGRSHVNGPGNAINTLRDLPVNAPIPPNRQAPVQGVHLGPDAVNNMANTSASNCFTFADFVCEENDEDFLRVLEYLSDSLDEFESRPRSSDSQDPSPGNRSTSIGLGRNTANVSVPIQEFGRVYHSPGPNINANTSTSHWCTTEDYVLEDNNIQEFLNLVDHLNANIRDIPEPRDPSQGQNCERSNSTGLNNARGSSDNAD